MNDRTIWKHRWATLRQMMTDMVIHLREQELRLEKEQDTKRLMISRFDTIQTLVTCLQRFGDIQFDFFYNGFDDDENNLMGGYLKPSSDYPQDYVFRKTLDQIGHDLSLFQTIILQRETAGENARLREALDTADRLAYQALEPAIKAGLIHDATVLTYFQKSASVRLIPYAPIALVAIPHSCVALPELPGGLPDPREQAAASRDFLAIPHEVGHYVFRHGQFGKQTLEEALREVLYNEDDVFTHWLEEIFADVYAILVAGPVIALDFMNMMMNYNPAEFIATNTHWPTPAIRPQGFIAVLRAMNYINAADAVEKKWKELLEQQGHFVPNNIRVLGDGLERVSEAVFKLQTFDVHPFGDQRWTDNLAKVDQLYPDFAEYVAQERAKDDDITPEAVMESVKDGEKQIMAKLNDREWRMGESDGLSNLWIDALRNIAISSEGDNDIISRHIKIPAQVWSLVLSMNGWAIEGPGGPAMGSDPWGN